MKVRVDSDHFGQQRRRFSLRFCCDDCAYFFDIGSEQAPGAGVCAHGWPTADHRRSRYAGSVGEVVFCKEFELR